MHWITANAKVTTAGPLTGAPMDMLKKFSTRRDLLDQQIFDAVSDRYKVSRNPGDFVYTVARAVTADVPNQNGDAFPEDELLSLNPMAGVMVFQTFINDPLHVEHLSDDPTAALGFILDSHYNTEDARDKFVETLVLIDRKKNPVMAKEISSGARDSFSMGCFIKDTNITMADGREIPIQDVKEGDEVITHMGRRRKVEQVFVRWYSGPLKGVRTKSNHTTWVTPEHPFWSLSRPAVCACGCGQPMPISTEQGIERRFGRALIQGHQQNIVNTMVEYSPEKRTELQAVLDGLGTFDFGFKEVGHLKPHDMVSFPILGETEDVQETKDQMIAIGYFLAEGSFLKDKGKRIGVEFSLGTHETEKSKKLIGALERAFPGKNVRSYSRESRHTLAIHISGKDVAGFFHERCGEYADGKSIEERLLYAPIDLQKAMLVSWLEGDGHLRLGRDELRWTASTASPALASQMRLIMARLGIRAYHAIQEQEGRMPAFIIGTSDPEDIQSLISESVYSALEVPEKAKTHTKKHGEYLVWPIHEIGEIEYEGLVYNFEVEEDHSYIADGMAVHNCLCEVEICSFCNKASRSDAEFCDHMRHMRMQRIGGKLVYGRCRGVTFTELSSVANPADAKARQRFLLAASAKMDARRVPLITRLGFSPSTSREIARYLDARMGELPPSMVELADRLFGEGEA